MIALCVCATAVAQEEKGKTPPAAKKPEKKVSAPLKTPLKAPPKFAVKLQTTKGDVVIEVTRKWAPIGADHFYNLVKTGYYDDCAFFRTVPAFVIQWGLTGDPKATANWRKPIKDDPVVASNLTGYITYAKTSRPNSRTTQLFVNMKDNGRLDRMGFAPFGKVTKGFDVLKKLYSGYGEDITQLQYRIEKEGNKYLKAEWPKLDYIKKATVLVPKAKGKATGPAGKAAPAKPPAAPKG